MKERLIGLIKTYILFVCIFILQKPLFILYYSSLYAGTSWTDPFKIIWNGLPLDLSLAGYLTAIPGLFFIASAWTLSKALRRIWNGYYFFIAILLAVIFIVDIGLYEYWASAWMLHRSFISSLLPKMRWQVSVYGRCWEG